MSGGDPCPYCGHLHSMTMDTRPAVWGRRRTRKCSSCGLRWTTREINTNAIRSIRNLQKRLLEASGLVEELSQLIELVRSDEALLQHMVEDEALRDEDEPPIKFIAEDNAFGKSISSARSKLLHPKGKGGGDRPTQMADVKVPRGRRR